MACRQQPPGPEEQRHRSQAAGAETESVFCNHPDGRRAVDPIDNIIDASGAQRARHQETGRDAFLGYEFADNRLGAPPGLEAGLAASRKELHVATAQKVEADIEKRRSKTGKYAAVDQAVAGTVDLINCPGRAFYRAEEQMLGDCVGHWYFELPDNRPADDVGTLPASRANDCGKPTGHGHFIVIDHQQKLGLRKASHCLAERTVDGMAIALPLFRGDQEWQAGRGEKFAGKVGAGLRRGDGLR